MKIECINDSTENLGEMLVDSGVNMSKPDIDELKQLIKPLENRNISFDDITNMIPRMAGIGVVEGGLEVEAYLKSNTRYVVFLQDQGNDTYKPWIEIDEQ